MQLQQIHSEPPMSHRIMLGGNSQNPQLDQKPMDISAILNPPDKPSTTASHHFGGQLETHQHLVDSHMNYWTKKHLQLPRISLEPVHGQCQSRPRYQLPPINPPSPQALEYSSDHQTTLNTVYNNNYTTAPPSSSFKPLHRFPNHSQCLFESFPTDRQQDQHFPSSTSRAALSPRRRAKQELRLRESCWNAPHHQTHALYAPAQQQVVKSHYSSQYDASYSPKALKHLKKPHSNKPYTMEQVHFMRYHKEDCGKMSWPDILTLFIQRFPEYQNLECPLTVPCLSSRYYRDNKVPMLDEQGKLVLDSNDRFIMVPWKIRQRNTADGKCIPYLFVDMHPELASIYDWVKPEDKARAERILQSLDEEVEELGISSMCP
jgi:hypothetical protein